MHKNIQFTIVHSKKATKRTITFNNRIFNFIPNFIFFNYFCFVLFFT